MRDATDYYNLLTDTLKNGRNQIKYIYEKIEKAIEKGKYINIRTGGLMKEKDCRNNNYYFLDDCEYPLCYHFSCRGLARNRVIKRIMNFYLCCLREYHRTRDEEKMKQLIEEELELARNNYEHLNKNNNGYDDLKLFNIPPHRGEPKEVEDSVNSSSFINDENSNEENSFINDGEIEEENEEKFFDEENDSNENNEEIEENKEIQDNSKVNEEEKENNKVIKDSKDEENNPDINDKEDKKEEKINKKKIKLVKNGKNVVNKYMQELENLEENYDGEKDLEYEDYDLELNLDLDTKYDLFKNKKLCKTNLLKKKTKRNIISDSEDDQEDKEEKRQKNNSQEKKISLEMKYLLKKEEESDNMNCGDNKIERKKMKDSNNDEYYKGLKENIFLRQGNLDAFLGLIS